VQNTHITQQTSIEELDLTVRQFNTLKRGGCNTIEDITRGTVKDLVKIRNMGMRDLTSILLRLDHYGFRCSDCSHEEYPDLRSCVGTVIDKAVKQARDERPRAWNYGKRKPLDKFNPDGILLPYQDNLIPNLPASKGRFYIISKEEYHIKKYGIRPEALVVFDQELPFVSGTLSCFKNPEGIICFSDQIKEEGLTHLGRVIAVVNYYT